MRYYWYATGILLSTKIRKRGRNSAWPAYSTRPKTLSHSQRRKIRILDKRRDSNRDTGERIGEKRDSLIEHAFRCPLDYSRTNAQCFVQSLCQVLRKQGGIQTEHDHDLSLQDHTFETGSRHLSYLFRHTDWLHEDGSRSLHEMLNHGQTARKIRAMFNTCHEQLKWVNEAEVPAALEAERIQ